MYWEWLCIKICYFLIQLRNRFFSFLIWKIRWAWFDFIAWKMWNLITGFTAFMKWDSFFSCDEVQMKHIFMLIEVFFFDWEEVPFMISCVLRWNWGEAVKCDVWLWWQISVWELENDSSFFGFLIIKYVFNWLWGWEKIDFLK